jgi:hypothetical protein
MALTRRYSAPRTAVNFDASKPIASKTVRFTHMERKLQPSSIGAPVICLAATTLYQLKFFPELDVGRPCSWRNRQNLAVLRRQSEVGEQAIENLGFGQRAQ